jgi:NAD(P)-dependent dehydrogenase (short-subunit alcohol dehydrogenase family)
MVHYGMTKTAQIAVARGIAESIAGTGVTANSILAGPTESEGVGAFVAAMAKQQSKSKAEVAKRFFELARPSSLLKLIGDKRRSTAGRWRRREGASEGIWPNYMDRGLHRPGDVENRLEHYLGQQVG